MSQTEQEQQQAALREVAQRGRAQGRDHHQQIGVEAPLAQRVEGVAADVPPAEEIGAEVQGQARRPRQPQEAAPGPTEQHEQPRGQAKEQFPVLLEPAPQASDRDGVA